MNKKTQLISMGIGVVLSTAMAASAVCVLAAGLGFEISALSVYGLAALAALLGGMFSLGGGAGLASIILLVAAYGGLLAINTGNFSAISAVVDGLRGLEAEADMVARGGRLLSQLVVYVLSAMFALMLMRREFTPMAIFLFFVAVVAGYSMADGIGLAMVVPGLMAAVAAFALSGSVQQDAYAVRVAIPAVVCVAIALMFVPSQRLTWQPLEEAAGHVRDIFEQYFNFSRERIAFSINEMGYDHAGKIDDEVVAMLGGPANPQKNPVMTVNTQDEVLLRGTIRTTYTGYSWVDNTIKNRYLYYDITHSRIRDNVFGREFGVESVSDKMPVSVEMLDDGTSTLFVPAAMDDFSMDLSTAVYYNSAGEIFLSREVQAGDKYSLIAMNPRHGEDMAFAVGAAVGQRDDNYASILERHTELPTGIESAVYTLAINLTQDITNPYEKAKAIRDYVRSNYHYTLDVEYPPENRDFVSYFLLESKEGYCSYFASAMAVMCRIAGLPARYVEGYAVRPEASGSVTITGEDAHAWVEVYFNGVGWIPFDPSAGDEAGDSDDEDSYSEPGGADDESPEESEKPFFEPSPSPTPTLPPNSGDNSHDGENEPTPEPSLPPEDDFPEDDPNDGQDDFFPPEDNENPFDEPDRDRNDASHGWLWILLVILLILLLAGLAVMWMRRRLENANPVALSAKTKDARMAAMILYRANLTLLAHMGQGPVRGESPEAFVERLAKQYNNPDYSYFVNRVSMNTYAGKPLDKEAIQAGRRAYAAFMENMRPMEKLRFTLTRIFHGLGNFESIP